MLTRFELKVAGYRDPRHAGVIFLSFAFLFLFRAKREPALLLCAAFFSDYGIELIILGLWSNIQDILLFANLFCFIVGTLLTPIGSFLIFKIIGRGKRAHTLIVGIGAASVLTCLVGSISIVSGGSDDFFYTLDYGLFFASLCVVAIVEARELRPFRHLPRQIKIFFMFMILTIALVGAMMLLQAFDLESALYGLSLPLVIMFSIVAGVVYKNSDIFFLLESQSKRIRYSRSSLNGIDTTSRIADLEKLMRKHELFRDQDLSLDRLAEKLGLTSHQLSELLNLYVGKAFPAYVLNFRIGQAKRELADPHKKTILDIAFSCGFSSKSTFNEAFRKETGLTPSTYRKHYFDSPRGAKSPPT
jgi:AraC-like DNA-binding protein